MTAHVLHWNGRDGYASTDVAAAMTGIRRAVTALRHAVEWTAGILLAPFVALPALLALMAAWPAFLLFVPSMAIARTVAFFAGESVQSGDGTSPAARRQATFGAAVPAAA